MTRRITLMFTAAMVLAGCDDGDAESCLCEAGFRETNTNGIGLNGIGLNGIGLNGIGLNGIGLNGDRLYAPDGSGDYIDHLTLNLQSNQQVASATLVGSNLTVLTVGGETLSGAQLDKARFEFELQEGGKHLRSVWVRSVAPKAPGSDIWIYSLDVKEGTGSWKPLCVDHNGEPTEAILVGDVWNPLTGARRGVSGGVTFACRDFAVAKCVEWGYRPWASVNGTSLSDFHQACTRLVRADFCGDSTPHTVPGTPVHVLDQIGVQNVDPNANYVVEAEWGPNGAVCLNSANMRVGAQQLGCSIPACGASFASGGLIQSGKIVQ